MPIGSIWQVKACASRLRPREMHALLTNQEQRNIINPDLWQQTESGRLQIGIPAGFRLEQVAGFVLECMAGFVGIRTRNRGVTQTKWPPANPGRFRQ